MNTTNAGVKAMLEEIDAIFVKAKADPNADFNPPCKEGCFFCCFEAAFACEQEIDYILDGMTPTKIEELKPKLIAWLERAKPVLGHAHSDRIGIAWRLANIPCPLLKDGKCSVYERRPIGCRTFFARSHAENCEMPMRTHQKFADWGRPGGMPNALDRAQAKFLMTQERVYIDHIGALIARKVLGLNVVSAAAQLFAIEETA